MYGPKFLNINSGSASGRQIKPRLLYVLNAGANTGSAGGHQTEPRVPLK